MNGKVLINAETITSKIFVNVTVNIYNVKLFNMSSFLYHPYKYFRLEYSSISIWNL